MILTAIGMYFGVDRNFENYILLKFPNYGANLTKIEDNSNVQKGLSIVGNNLINAPEIVAGGDWFNSPPLKISDLRGKVVLVDFWTYTCINCIRTLPYIEKWYEKYKDSGLVVIGVHTPEFEFEKSAENVKKAISDFGITYPVVQDNNYDTWNAYANSYWPAKYLIDKDGKIVYTHFGEGNYDETESIIQKYLTDAGYTVNQKIDNPTYSIDSQTPETYLGYARMGYFAQPDQLVQDKEVDYTLPSDLALNHFAFGGKWIVASEYSLPEANSQLLFGFEAKNVYLVMKLAGKLTGKVKVFLDDKETGEITVDSDKLYDIVQLKNSGQHTLKLEFEDSNIQVYAFTFG
jgi:thiol-disulfide isomerase/thioredoxin